MATVLSIFCLVACGRNSNVGITDSVPQDKDTHYYSDTQAKNALENSGYHIANDFTSTSQDGYYSCHVSIQAEEYKYLSVSGSVELTANYSDFSGTWSTHISPNINYNWHVSGSWYANTENYDVYIDFIDFSNSQMQIILEAQYDSTEGGKGSYGEKNQTCTLNFSGDRSHQEDGWLYCEVSGGYPIFNLRIEKDSMTIWQLYDSYHADLIKQ